MTQKQFASRVKAIRHSIAALELALRDLADTAGDEGWMNTEDDVASAADALSNASETLEIREAVPLG